MRGQNAPLNVLEPKNVKILNNPSLKNYLNYKDILPLIVGVHDGLVVFIIRLSQGGLAKLTESLKLGGLRYNLRITEW